MKVLNAVPVVLALLVLSGWAAPTARAQDADLSALTTGPDETAANQQIDYSITASNFGPDDADNATLTDAVPAATTFVSLTQNSGPALSCTAPAAGDGGDVTCSLATLPAGAQATLTLTVLVDADAPPGSFINNQASIFSDTFDPNSENDTSTASTLVGPVTIADMGVSQAAPEGRVPGADLTYAITVTNGGPAAAEDATMTDPLPGTTTFVSIDSPAGWSCTTPAVGDAGTVSCTQPSLPPGATATFTLVVHIPDDTPSGTELLNVVTVSTTDSDPNTENDQAATNTTVASADLGVSVSAPATATAGESLAYTITVTNAGPDQASSAQVTDTLPDGVTFVSLTQNSGPFFAASTPAAGQGGAISLARDQFGAGTTAQFTVEVAIEPRTPDGTIADTATVSSPTGDPDDANNSSTATTTVAGLDANLGVTASGPATAKPRDQLTYTVTLTNAGPDAAYDVAFANHVPLSTRFVSFTQSNGPAFDLATPAAGDIGTVRATRGLLEPGESATFSLTVVVDAGTADATELTSTATASSAINDPTASDDSASVSTTIALPATPSPPTGTEPPIVTTPPPATTRRAIICLHVPHLKRKTYRAVRRTLRHHHCGKVRVASRGHLLRKNGRPTRVTAQRPRPGKRLYRAHRLRITLR